MEVLQRPFTLRSAGTPKIAEPPALPDFDNSALMDAATFHHRRRARRLAGRGRDVALRAHRAAYVTGGAAARAEVDAILKERWSQRSKSTH